MDSLEWESGTTGGSDDENDDEDWIESEEMNDPDWKLVGELRRIEDGVGDYNSRLYEVAVDLGETVLFYGKASLDRAVDRIEAEPGDVVAMRNTGETSTFENDDGELIEASEFEAAIVDKDADNGGEN